MNRIAIITINRIARPRQARARGSEGGRRRAVAWREKVRRRFGTSFPDIPWISSVLRDLRQRALSSTIRREGLAQPRRQSIRKSARPRLPSRLSFTSRFARVILVQGPCRSSLYRSKFNGWSPKGIHSSRRSSPAIHARLDVASESWRESVLQTHTHWAWIGMSDRGPRCRKSSTRSLGGNNVVLRQLRCRFKGFEMLSGHCLEGLKRRLKGSRDGLPRAFGRGSDAGRLFQKCTSKGIGRQGVVPKPGHSSQKRAYALSSNALTCAAPNNYAVSKVSRSLGGIV